MYPLIFIVLIACVTTVMGNTSRTSKCSNIICPAVKATICVKIKQANNNQIQTNYVMMSKCEMKQINCFNDAKTAVVPVKRCNAKSLREGGLLANHVPNVPELPSENDKKKLTQEDNNKAPDETENNDPDGTAKETDESQETPEDPNEDGGTEAPQKEEDESNATEIPREETEQPEDPQLAQNPDEDGGSEVPQIENDENDGTEVPRDESGESDDMVTLPEDLNTEADDQPNGANTGDEGACPRMCPIRDVMVCARCSHGVYRTFMSACYMRMYICHNPTEKLELVSRHACIGSAPYLGEMARPGQSLMEPRDKDPVLNYIFASRNSGHWE